MNNNSEFFDRSQNANISQSDVSGNQMGRSDEDLTQSRQDICGNNNNVNSFTRNVVNLMTNIPIDGVRGILSFANTCVQNVVAHFSPKNHCLEMEISRRLENIHQESLELQRSGIECQERMLKLKEEEARLQREKFEWEQKVVRLKLSMIERHQSEIIDVERKKLQMQSDIHYLKLQVSRDDTLRLLSKEKGKFVIIPAPPLIQIDEPIFKSLSRMISSEIQNNVVKEYNLSKEVRSPISSSSIFCDSVGDAVAQNVGETLSPLSTLILRSDITYEDVYILVTATFPNFRTPTSEGEGTAVTQVDSVACSQIHLSLPPLNWVRLKEVLELGGMDPKHSIEAVAKWIVVAHKIVVFCFADVYCLNLNPYHSPRLFNLLEGLKLPKILQEWTEEYRIALESVQKSVQEGERSRAERLLRQSNTLSTDWNFTSVIAAIGVGIFLLFSWSNQTLPPPHSHESLSPQEQVYWDQLQKAISVWDVQTAQQQLPLLSQTQNSCVASFAMSLREELEVEGEEGFRAVNSIKRELNTQSGCNLKTTTDE